MTKNKLKQKCTERVKIFQQAMESCHSSSPMDCIEWFSDRIANLEKRIAELEQENAELIQENEEMKKGLGCETCQIHLEYMRLNNKIADLEKENAELKSDNEARKFAMAMSEKVEKQLREENAELDCQKNRNKYCYSCANATERCFKNEIGCPCDKYKSYKEDLEQKISVLLSCKNCSENKGGFICQKEYEDKCLAQKIQFIKELQQGNAELKKTYRKQRNKRIDELQKANAELKARLKDINLLTPELEKENTELKAGRDINVFTKQLTKAKKIISEYINILNGDTKNWKKTQEKAEQFLNGENIILEDAQVGNSPFDADEVFNKEMKAYPEQFFKD